MAVEYQAHRIYVPLPEKETRLAILTNLLKSVPHKLSASDCDKIVAKLDGMLSHLFQISSFFSFLSLVMCIFPSHNRLFGKWHRYGLQRRSIWANSRVRSQGTTFLMPICKANTPKGAKQPCQGQWNCFIINMFGRAIVNSCLSATSLGIWIFVSSNLKPGLFLTQDWCLFSHSFRQQLEDPKLKAVRPVEYKDFENSLARIRPSVSKESLIFFESWNKDFGSQSFA